MSRRFSTKILNLTVTVGLIGVVESPVADARTAHQQLNCTSGQTAMIRANSFNSSSGSLNMPWAVCREMQAPVLFGFVDLEIQLAVRLAVEGAAARLARPGCQDVLSDFSDGAGQSLSFKLEASGRSAAEAFAQLRFFDDRPAPQCRTGRLAFTQKDSRLVRVCGRQFRDRDRLAGEIILIHEFLHTLGLGENPPTSQAITDRVAMRCGD